MQNFTVIKRDGRVEAASVEKLNRVAQWAVEDLDASASAIVMGAIRGLHGEVTTTDIHRSMIQSAVNLIKTDIRTASAFSIAAGRLEVFLLRKDVYNSFTLPSLSYQLHNSKASPRYDQHLKDSYTEDELAELDKYLDHDKDMEMHHISIQQLVSKYIVADRGTKELLESPQFVYMLSAMTFFVDEDPSIRMDLIKKRYGMLRDKKISDPSPIMVGMRTSTRQFSSCVLIEHKDTLDSMKAVNNAITDYVSQRAGIGINNSALRAQGSPVRGGEVRHTGQIPIIRNNYTNTVSMSMGGYRKGSATVYYQWWHREIESILVLKNNRGTEETRIRGLDYAITKCDLFKERIYKNQEVALFSTSDVPGLYDTYGRDPDKFRCLYESYEADTSIPRTTIKACDLFMTYILERAQTGRIYSFFIDNANRYGAFNPIKAPVRQSNLCLEIALPTKPLTSPKNPDEGEIALCTLAAFNLAVLDKLDDLKDMAMIVVRSLDNLLSYQNYPVQAALKALMRRALGVGVIGYATYLAKRGLIYGSPAALKETHRLFEAIQYWLLVASCALAKERGRCELFHETKYADGILPIDNYHNTVDKLAGNELNYDWEALRKDIAKYGLRNSTMTALMPSETSSQVAAVPNGIEPIRGYFTTKGSKNSKSILVVPGAGEYEENYVNAWKMPYGNRGYLNTVIVMSKFLDQAASVNTYYSIHNYLSGDVPQSEVIGDVMYAWENGLLSLYYHNTEDGSGGEITMAGSSDMIAGAVSDMINVVDSEEESCAGGACMI